MEGRQKIVLIYVDNYKLSLHFAQANLIISPYGINRGIKILVQNYHIIAGLHNNIIMFFFIVCIKK
jgi:hypothetical protein